jgi:hypothetical protein
LSSRCSRLFVVVASIKANVASTPSWRSRLVPPRTAGIGDAQWLDQASADALVFVARRLEAEGVVLLFGAPQGDRRTFTAPGLPERRLLGLDPRAATILLEESAPGLDERGRAQLVTRTAGNPLALLELPALLSTRQRTGAEPLLSQPRSWVAVFFQSGMARCLRPLPWRWTAP